MTPLLIVGVAGDGPDPWESMQHAPKPPSVQFRGTNVSSVHHPSIHLCQNWQDLPYLPPPLLNKRDISSNSVKWCRKRERQVNPLAVSITLSLKSRPPVKLHLKAFIYLSVKRNGSKEGGGGIRASSQPPLLPQMHNSVFLSQQPELRWAPPSHAASSLLIWKKLRSHSVVPSGFLALHTLSHTCMIYSYLFIHGGRLRPQWTSWGNIFVLGRGSVSASLWVVTVTLE